MDYASIGKQLFSGIAQEPVNEPAAFSNTDVANYLSTVLGTKSTAPGDLLGAFQTKWGAGDTSVAQNILADAAKYKVSDSQLASVFGVGANDVSAIRSALNPASGTANVSAAPIGGLSQAGIDTTPSAAGTDTVSGGLAQTSNLGAATTTGALGTD
ncbi:hypothetical protein EBZ39_17575, partial [bacterium]|nr:hypothetical protein [bacterium]